jgi:hypothetical protein
MQQKMSESIQGRSDLENLIKQSADKIKEIQQCYIDVEKDNQKLTKDKEELLDCVESQINKIKSLEIRIADFHHS